MPYKMKGFPAMKGTGAMKAMKAPLKRMEGAMKAMDGAMKVMDESPKKAMSPNKKTIAKDKNNVDAEWNKLSDFDKRRIIDDFNSQLNPKNPEKD